MALQTLSSASSAASSTSSSGSGGGGGTTLNANSSLPFSFLITFVAIFLFFLGCGLGSRRVAYEIRRNLGLLDHSAAQHPSEAQERPVLWDVYPDIVDTSLHGRKATWTELLPLSATYLRTKPPDDPPDGHEGVIATPPSPRARDTPARTYPSPLSPSVYYSPRFGRMGAPTPALVRPPPTPAPARAVPVAPAAPPQPLPLSQQSTLRASFVRGALRVPLLALLVLRYRPSWIIPPTPVRPVQIPEPAKLPICALQVAVMISMPSPARRRAAQAKALEAGYGVDDADSSSGEKRRGKERASQEMEIEEVEIADENLGEYTLGIAELPWEPGNRPGSASKAD
ncbi:hypothetical protein CERSUDRAFT_116338 [Gelatoporia subvermispora B]|uniref:Uncharacterized protein n=1 Tax=Ceriporiopsis subvermispora (strain B) TaxID=914234 RepID=M2QEY1_CERS8|nr:hypothetical protein CERSUDRAFT_116338 [Gelatoporia subvermispora B]